jgi:hypothetical protein
MCAPHRLHQFAKNVYDQLKGLLHVSSRSMSLRVWDAGITHVVSATDCDWHSVQCSHFGLVTCWCNSRCVKAPAKNTDGKFIQVLVTPQTGSPKPIKPVNPRGCVAGNIPVANTSGYDRWHSVHRIHLGLVTPRRGRHPRCIHIH